MTNPIYKRWDAVTRRRVRDDREINVGELSWLVLVRWVLEPIVRQPVKKWNRKQSFKIFIFHLIRVDAESSIVHKILAIFTANWFTGIKWNSCRHCFFKKVKVDMHDMRHGDLHSVGAKLAYKDTQFKVLKYEWNKTVIYCDTQLKMLIPNKKRCVFTQWPQIFIWSYDVYQLDCINPGHK